MLFWSAVVSKHFISAVGLNAWLYCCAPTTNITLSTICTINTTVSTFNTTTICLCGYQVLPRTRQIAPPHNHYNTVSPVASAGLVWDHFRWSLDTERVNTPQKPSRCLSTQAEEMCLLPLIVPSHMLTILIQQYVSTSCLKLSIVKTVRLLAQVFKC